MSILAINTGSSSLKFGLYDDAGCETLLVGSIDWADGNRQAAKLHLSIRGGGEVQQRVSVPDYSDAAACAVRVTIEHDPSRQNGQSTIQVVGHRVVHGGVEYRESTRLDAKVKAAIARLCELAPLHNPPALKAIEAAEAALPGIAQIAVFDTAFCAQLPPKAHVYPLPYEWSQEWGVRRFGFHGISNAWCALRAAEMLGRKLQDLRLITCHLGSGCSATAVRGGAAVATTMGFSPLEGLMMGTRCGSIDPGVLLHLLRTGTLTLEQLDDVLNHASGLLGVSGVSPDLAKIEAAAALGNPRAHLAFEMFADRVRSAIGALTVTMGGLDALIFTDRIGEQSSALRAAVCEGLQCLGARLAADQNAKAKPDADIATADSSVRILVLRTQEELMIAQEAARFTQSSSPDGPGSFLE